MQNKPYHKNGLKKLVLPNCQPVSGGISLEIRFLTPSL